MASLEAIFKLTDRYTKTMNRIDKATSAATGNITRASQSADNLNRKLDKTSRVANSASSSIRKLVRTVVSLAAIQKGISIVDEYTNTKARLDLINDGLQTQAELQEKIFDAANRSRGTYTEMASAVSKMGLLAGDAFTSNDELLGFTELVQKSFAVGGADTSEQMGAMRQLTQAMASGRLQGDELVSIMENAPMIYDAIAKYMDLSKGKLKELSSEGAITSDIIKNAMFTAADDINTKFETMPQTFGSIWNRVKNGAMQAFMPVMDQINNAINAKGFDQFVDGVIAGLFLIAEIASGVIGIVGDIASIFIDNWSWISPIIYGVIAALVVYNAVLGIGWLTTLKNIAVKIWDIAVTWAQQAATIALTAATVGLSAALAAMPLTWIVIGVILLIAVFYAAIGAINHFTGSSISATGLIAGAFLWLGALLLNILIGTINAMIQFIWTRFVEPFIGIIEWVLNVANGGFNSFGGAVANLIGNIISWFLSLGKVVTKIIDAIFGTDWTGGLNALQNKVISWGKNDKAITLSREAPSINKRFDMTDAFNTGYNAGANFENKIKDFSLGEYLGAPTLEGLPSGIDPNQFLVDSPAGGLGSKGNPATVKGTGAGGKVEVDISDEDLKYLRDIAERDYINKFSTATLAPNIEVSFGDIHEEVDIEKLRNRLNKILEEEIAIAAEGAY